MSGGPTGYGQMDPSATTSVAAAVQFAVRQMMAQMDTAKLVQVKAVSGGGGAIAAAGTVDVLPLVNQVDNQGFPVPQGTVYGLPWWRLQGGTGAVICDPAVGDIGYVICLDRDTSSALVNKAQANPGSNRRYNIADGIYVGGIANGAPTQYVVFSDNGIKVVDKNGNVLEMKASGFELTGTLVKINGNLQVTGSVIAGFGTGDQVGLQTHLHTSGGVGSPTSVPTPGT